MQTRAAAELVRLGGDPEGFVARLLEPAHLENADLVLAATLGVRGDTLGVFPRAMRRTFTLLEFAELCRALPLEPGESAVDLVARAAAQRASVAALDLDVPDPYGRSEETHRATADQIAAAVDAITHRLRPALVEEGR